MSATIKQLKAFVAAAQARNFAEAGGRVHLSQPALSIAIKNLEEIVGGRLLARTTRSLALTPEGEAFYPVAQRLLADWDNAFADVHNLFAMRRGKLSIAAMPSFASSLLPDVLAYYCGQHPNIDIAVQDVVAENVVDMVRTGRVEIGVSFDPGEYDELDFEVLFEDKFFVAAPKQHALMHQSKICLRDLPAYPFIALQRPSSIRQLIETATKACDIKLAIAFEAHQLASIGSMIANGLGLSIVPSLTIKQMESLGVECKPLTGSKISRNVGIITRRKNQLSAPATAMRQALLDRVTGP
jgi:LysR family carnitine catabolism transcriptional activator|tara:strand:+ start:2089 stop:2982 length:894 start_codon:yes stop_codon:yes gene_type:complete